MCFGLDIFGTGKAAKKQAAAIEAQAAQDRLLAKASQQNLESQMAQQKAAEAATQLLNKPIEQTAVQVGETAPAATVDESTGRRRTARSTFQIGRNKSGLGGL